MIANGEQRTKPLRIGILGAARIAPAAIIRPTRRRNDVIAYAIATRSLSRTRIFATRHSIPVVHQTYADLLGDENIDAVYIPLPNSLHYEWTLRALRAGKHVLCEKPLAANSVQAQKMANVARQNQRILMEAFHYRYHPLLRKAKQLIGEGDLGQIRRLEAYMCVPSLRLRDIRYQYKLAGGAMMDTGCYTINAIRYLAGKEPVVVSAQARRLTPQIDRAMDVELRFDEQMSGRIGCSLLSRRILNLQVIAYGMQGALRIWNPCLPHWFNLMIVKTPEGVTRMHTGGATTYDYQLEAFIQAIRNQAKIPTDAEDAIANMQIIDQIYMAAGMSIRG